MQKVLNGNKHPNFNMALNWDQNPYHQADMNIKDHAIQGKMITALIELSEYEAMLFNDEKSYREVIREKMTKLLVEIIIENNLAEFTYMNDPLTGTKKIHGRCFVTPKDNVHVLRTYGRLK